MPENTPVERVYEALKEKGYDKGKAARIAQSQTGLSLATGKPPKHEQRQETPLQMMMARLRQAKQG